MGKSKKRRRLDTDADVREIDPLIVHRDVRDPMSDDVQISPTGHRGSTVQAGEGALREGN